MLGDRLAGGAGAMRLDVDMRAHQPAAARSSPVRVGLTPTLQIVSPLVGGQTARNG